MVHSLSRKKLGATVVLSAFAGYIDGFGFVYLGGYFVSFMTGNTTRASVDLAQSSLLAAGFAFLLIAAFVAGAASGTLVPGKHARGEIRVLVLVSAVVSLAAFGVWLDWRWVAGFLLAFAMGALNTVFSRGGEVSFGITYMTGSLVKLAQALVKAGQGGKRWGWVRHFLLWAAIAAGAVLGASASSHLGPAALALAVVVLVLLMAVPRLRTSLYN